jgi:hypothetical protein
VMTPATMTLWAVRTPPRTKGKCTLSLAAWQSRRRQMTRNVALVSCYLRQVAGAQRPELGDNLRNICHLCNLLLKTAARMSRIASGVTRIRMWTQTFINNAHVCSHLVQSCVQLTVLTQRSPRGASCIAPKPCHVTQTGARVQPPSQLPRLHVPLRQCHPRVPRCHIHQSTIMISRSCALRPTTRLRILHQTTIPRTMSDLIAGRLYASRVSSDIWTPCTARSLHHYTLHCLGAYHLLPIRPCQLGVQLHTACLLRAPNSRLMYHHTRHCQLTHLLPALRPCLLQVCLTSALILRMQHNALLPLIGQAKGEAW